MTANTNSRLSRDAPRSARGRGPFEVLMFAVSPSTKRGTDRFDDGAARDFPSVHDARAPEPFQKDPLEVAADRFLVGAERVGEPRRVEVVGAGQAPRQPQRLAQVF